jgi:two-component system, NtrC family, nitrogen regulation response regulator NtrX
MHILIVDDEKNIRVSLGRFFELQDHSVVQAATGQEALDLARRTTFDCILLDLKLPDLDGLQVLERLRISDPFVPVILLTAHGSTQIAVEAMRKGAFDFFEKPANEEKLLIAVNNAYQLFRLNREKSLTFRELDRKYELVGNSPVMQKLREQIDLVAPRLSRVLITGESGTGKELVAFAIHRGSPRREKPFVKVNCAAIPHELFESELFGHEKGAFTGALQQRIGKFEQADGGTLFLDEIGEIPLALQPKILRAIQENELERVGAQKEIHVDVRVLAATNRKLEDELKKGAFREDLYYRLNVFPIEVSPLRQHRQDLPLLVQHFLERISEENNMRRKAIAEEALLVLTSYDYPGNIRELRNLIERLLIITQSETIKPADVQRVIPQQQASSGEDALLYSQMEATERTLIYKTLEENRWHVSRAAKILGLERSHLYKKMKKYGISRPE